MRQRTAPIVRDGRFLIAVALGVVGFGALLALNAESAAPESAKGTLAISELRSLSGDSEHGLVQITAQPDSAEIIAVLIGITVDPSDPSENTFYLVASRRSCAAIRESPDDPGVIAKLAKVTVDSSGSAYIGTDITGTIRLRGAKSLLGINSAVDVVDFRARGAPVACGPISQIKLADIFVTG